MLHYVKSFWHTISPLTKNCTSSWVTIFTGTPNKQFTSNKKHGHLPLKISELKLSPDPNTAHHPTLFIEKGTLVVPLENSSLFCATPLWLCHYFRLRANKEYSAFDVSIVFVRRPRASISKAILSPGSSHFSMHWLFGCCWERVFK